ncbi:MAG TPA: glycosyltransferase [Thermoleophilaceae bacterium]|nr:glycosyltransferase [Thermoleophilaceae bacterium]
MRILHAGWGFRPWRGGGLISYAEDVMEAQAAAGHDVAYFFGGRHYPLVRGPRLRRWRRRGVRMIEMLGSPIPVGLDRGTRFPELDLEEPEVEALFEAAVDEHRPDVLHVQELLGLPSSIVDRARGRGVPVVMTLQDYFPLCPTLKLYDSHGRVCMRRDPAAECVHCCGHAPLGTRHIRDMTIAFELQRAGRVLPWARDPAKRTLTTVLPRMPSGLPVDERAERVEEPPATEADYRRRREVNLDRLARIDALVGASTRTTEIYATLGVPRARLRTLQLTAGHVAALTPRVIDSPPRPVRFATLAGAASEEKGCLLLLDAARRLEAIVPGAAYTIDVHGVVNDRVRSALERVPAVRIRRRYGPGELDSILEEADVGLVPSLWEEVLANAGLEFIAKGVPVVANALGGMPDYTIPGLTGWLNRSCGAEELAGIMAAIAADPGQVVELNASIRARRDDFVTPLDRHIEQLGAIYEEVIAAGSGGRS